MMTKPLAYSFAFILAVGAAVACGDDNEGSGDGGDGKGGKGGTAGSSGTSGASGSAGKGGNSGASGTGGKGGTAGEGGTSGTAGGGGSPDGGVGAEGGVGPGGQGGEGGEGPMMCGTVADTASPVPEVQASGTEPTPMGGTLVDGTYELTAWDVYAPSTPDSDMHSTTLRISGGTFEVVVNGTSRQSGVIAALVTSLTITPTCPPGGTPIIKPYTSATASTVTTLQLFTQSEHRVETLTRQ